MSTGYNRKFHREHMRTRLIKSLVRRARSKCELCGKSGAKLEVYELAPLPEEPVLENSIFICEACLRQIKHPEKADPAYWRCLNTAVWSEEPAVQVMAIRLLRRVASASHSWAEDLLEHAYLDPEKEAWSHEAT